MMALSIEKTVERIVKEELAEPVTLEVLKELLLPNVRTFNKNGRMWHLAFVLRCSHSHDTL